MWSALDTVFKQKFSVDLFEFSDMKYSDSKLSLIEYMHCYLANMEFCFVSIKWLLFGFCSNQCLKFVVKFSKTHTMLVHFSGRTRPKRKKTENTIPWSFEACCQRVTLKAQFFFSLIFFFFFWCCMLCSTNRNCSHYWLLHRTNTYTLPERSVVSLWYHLF